MYINIHGSRPNLNSTGVYMLFGRNEDDKEAVYIGEAEEVFKRLQDRLREKDFWNEVIVFISKDENLNKAHIKYIENKIYEKAKATNRNFVMNESCFDYNNFYIQSLYNKGFRLIKKYHSCYKIAYFILLLLLI
ncbi:GIY-YIG nuclease family protein [Lysinibacillus sp. fls2-241-R2A-57]|uniref:GIY-YIG nuclease family protein n=1 Tax=Lysinibacillus sp. fls2-241-R2A-57 TaxID=3040292 RepID=UPI00255337BE|nr:GIY-YIG nuclease family protein [Lysinibacillus sp. fls2-241-R2A-57]